MLFSPEVPEVKGMKAPKLRNALLGCEFPWNQSIAAQR